MGEDQTEGEFAICDVGVGPSQRGCLAGEGAEQGGEAGGDHFVTGSLGSEADDDRARDYTYGLGTEESA